MLTRAINALCVGGENVLQPTDCCCFRGGGFDQQFAGFFCPGREFRQPAFLASSFRREVADMFIRRSDLPSRVLWRIYIDPVEQCRHVNLVQKRVPGLANEHEYLFAPYSAFRVVAAHWRAGTAHEPHEIELLAAVDNIGPSEDLPLAPWC